MVRDAERLARLESTQEHVATKESIADLTAGIAQMDAKWEARWSEAQIQVAQL